MLKPSPKYLLIIFILVSSLQYGQDRVVDSLTKEVSQGKEDTLKLKTLLRLAKRYYGIGEFAKTIQTARQAEQLAIVLIRKNEEALAINLQGNIYNEQGDYPRALNYYFRALKIQEERKNKFGISAILNNIGNIYKNLGDTATALKNYFESIRIKKEIGDTAGLGFTYNNAGLVYENTRKYVRALDYYWRALNIWKKLNRPEQESSVYDNIGNVYANLGKFDSALAFHYIAIEIRKKYDDIPGLASSYLNTGVIHTMKKDYSKAVDYLNQSIELSKQLESYDLLADAKESITEAYEKMNDHKNALIHYKFFISYRDSIFNEENTKKMVQSEMNYEFEKKEAAAKLEQEKKDAIASAEQKRRRIILFAISGFGLLVLGFAIFAYRSFLQKKKANIEISRQKNIIEEKQKEILDSIHYARRIQKSLMPTDKYIRKHLEGLRHP